MSESALSYCDVILECTRTLENLEACLDKAEQSAADRKFDVAVLLSGRLAPDMGPLTYQVQSACDYVKAGAAWLSGQTPPKHEDTEGTVAELRARIRKTAAYVETVTEPQYGKAASGRSDCPGRRGRSSTARITSCRSRFPTSISTSRWPTRFSATTGSRSERWISSAP
jgi:hypothetical protein